MKKTITKFSIKAIFICLLALLGNTTVNAQTTLVAGDIAFTGYNSNDSGTLANDFSFVLLKDILTGTIIKFTDNGYKIAGTNALNTAEGTLTWTSTTAMSRFTQVYIKIGAAGSSVTTISAGSIAGGFSNFILSQAGDQVLAYQGTSASPTFISGIHMNNDASVATQAGWDNMLLGTSFTSNRSDVPPGLTSGVNCIAPDPNIGTSEKDNGIYSCTGSSGATIANIRTAINTPANWTVRDIFVYTLAPLCTFSIAPPLSAIASFTAVSCNGGSNGSASVTASGGAGGYSYSWAPSGGSASLATGLVAGTYTCTITDAGSTSITSTVTVTQPTAISTATAAQTNVSCNGGSNGSASVAPSGGAGGYTYSWSPSGGTAATITGRTAGTYTVTVTDANACTATRSFTITQPAVISTATAAQTNVSCNGGSNGAASVTPSGGAGGYTYSWSPSGGTAATATGLSAGTYTVTVTDANACTATRNFTITQPAVISTATAAQTNVSCNGGSNGAASVTPSGGAGGYTYSWSPSGGTAATATGLNAGTYTVTVTDANACTATRNFTITQPAAISTATGSQTNVSCNGGSNGAASINVPTGGAGGYTYNWTPGTPTGDGTRSVTGLTSGTWTCTVTDANSCTATRTFTITQPTAFDTSVSLTSGVLTATQTGATYQWYECPNTIQIGATSQSFTPTAMGNYRVSINISGCSDTSSCVSVTTLQTGEFEFKNSFKIYPNPVQNILSVDFEDLENVVITISDTNGRTLINQKLNTTANSINIENLSKGMYLIKLTSDQGNETIKVLKN